MYWIGPLIGGGIAGALYQWFLRERGAGVITIYGEEEAPRRAA
jgi:glycine/D-amino acid oxidase-like deaminating enzyme